MTKSRSLRYALLFASFALLLAQSPAHAQSSFQTAPRVAGPVADSVRTRLQGNVSHVIRSAADQGEASSGIQLTHVRLVLSRSEDQKAAFETYLAQLQDKNSPNYHKWLTPDQVGKLYGTADSDIASATAWLESHGLKVETIAPFRIDIPFSGTVGQVEEAFQTQIHSFVKGNQHFYANTTAPSIPSALAPIVSGIAHLDTQPPRSFAHTSSLGAYDPKLKRNVSLSRGTAAHPDLTLGTSPDFDLYLVPGDAATIYDTPNTTFNANYTSSSGSTYDGTGATIGLGGNSSIQTSTIVNFRTLFLGDSTTSKIINNNDSTDPASENSDELEAYLDTETSGGLAPGATIHYYPSDDLFTGIEQAFTENTVDVFSLSFGACELDLPTADNQYLYQLWQTAAAQGITVTVSTGDSGSAACDDPTDSKGNDVADATGGLAVSGFASTPYNIAVGGTDFSALPGAFTTYAPENTANPAANYYRTATKYIPESTWNDSSTVDLKLAEDTPQTPKYANIVAGAGGKSSCSTNTDSVSSSGNVNLGNCTSGYPKPVWQRGTGVPSDSARDLPDVSLMAGNGADDSAWLVCSDDTDTSTGVITNCSESTSGFEFEGVGGTSASSPAFAGILALVVQKNGGGKTGRLGQASVELYDLFNGSNASKIFHDVTTGNNSVACTVNTTNCAKNTAGYYFETGYDTTTGYDLATGLGSVDVSNLIKYWGTGIGASTPTVKVTPASTSVVFSSSLSVTASVTGLFTTASGSTATPTGTVTLTTGSYTSSAETLNGSGDYTFTVPASTFNTAGSETITVTYSGDEYYASAKGTGSVTILAPAVTLSASSLTFNSATGTASAAQTVTITNSGTASLAIASIALSGTNASDFTLAPGTPACGTTLAASDACTLSLTFTPSIIGSETAKITITDNASNSPQTVSLSGTGGEPTGSSYTISAAAITIATVGNSGTSAITATGAGGYVGPTTVTISSCTLATSPTGDDTSDNPTCTITTPTVTFASGASTGSGGVLTIMTTGVSAVASNNPSIPWGRGTEAAGAIAIAGLLLFLPGRTRRWRSMLGAFLLIASIGILSGCGGGSHSVCPLTTTSTSSSCGGGGNTGTTPGVYTFTITGKDAAGTTQTATLTVTVS